MSVQNFMAVHLMAVEIFHLDKSTMAKSLMSELDAGVPNLILRRGQLAMTLAMHRFLCLGCLIWL